MIGRRVYGKEALIRAFVPDVWADARKALQQADRIMFFGYSLPALDIRSEKLFQRVISDNRRLDWVDVVNRSPGSAGRYSSLLPEKPLRWYPSIESFLGTDQFP
jgi:hypothetical protein